MIDMLHWLVLQVPMYMGATQAECNDDRGKKFLGIFPTWYSYIKDYGPIADQGNSCGFIVGDASVDVANAVQEYPIQIGLAVIDILLRAGALAAVAFIIMGGYKYMSSQGEPKNIEAAMATIINAAIGLGIVIFASVIVAFVGNSLGG